MAHTFTAAERAAVAAGRLAAFSKLEVTDPDGTWRDVSTGLLGVDWLNAVQISDNIDQNAAELSGALLRNTRLHSLSPFRSDSLINRNAGGSYAPMLDLWRKWRASTAIMPAGYAPAGADWKELSAGRIDRIDVGDEEIQLQGRSEDAVFLECWIAVERQYGSVAGVAVETVLQQVLDDNLGTGRANVGSSGYTVNTPVSPAVLMNTFSLPIGKLGLGLADIASKAKGFIFRFRYDSSNVHRPTFFKPDRTAAPGSEVWSLGPSEYEKLTKCAIDISGVRNVVKLTYPDATTGRQTLYSPKNTGTVACTAGAATFSTSQAGVIANGSRIYVHGLSGLFTVSAFNGTTGCTLSGSPTFVATNWGTSASLTRYDRFDLEIDLSYDAQVNNGTKAQDMDDAIRQDTEFPDLDQQFETMGFWFVQLHDYGKLYANGQHYDSDQYGGVTSILHSLAEGSVRSSVGLAGKPKGRYTTWQGLSRDTVSKSGRAVPYKRGLLWNDGKFATRASDASGTLIDTGVQQNLAGSPRAIAKGYQAGFVQDGGAVTFNPVYQNLPQILMRGGKAANATFPYDDFAAQLASASGFTCRAQNKNKGTITARAADFTAPTNVTSPGSTVGPATLASAPSYDNNYTARFGISVTLVGGPGQTAAVVAVETNDGVSGWIERATRTYYAGVSAGTYNFTGQEVPISDSSLGINDQVRLKLKSVTVSGAPGTTGSASLTGYDNTGGNGRGVTYNTSSGPTFETKTPGADDFIFWEAFEVSS